ncbi:hypothetical protein CJ030_MR1G028609 [Morella rubra]|uniref:F-box associated domain-containing protein n=1 Tax=Morella rubra TaxID=262757 RepID=A0A6A1WHE7_9ROSI|nr:hypothetical protein CJ030_MR1G028609 [Morella rubra]
MEEHDDQHEAVYFDNLSSLGGRLCLTGCRSLDIWLWEMKEYGVQESWAPACLENIHFPDTDLTSLCFLRIGQLLAIHNGKKLIRCYSGEETAGSFVANSRPFSEATMFVESLLSPTYYNGNDGQLFSE